MFDSALRTATRKSRMGGNEHLLHVFPRLAFPAGARPIVAQSVGRASRRGEQLDACARRLSRLRLLPRPGERILEQHHDGSEGEVGGVHVDLVDRDALLYQGAPRLSFRLGARI